MDTSYLVRITCDNRIPITVIWDALDSYFHDSLVSDEPLEANVTEMQIVGEENWRIE